jgi:hypothetical protein
LGEGFMAKTHSFNELRRQQITAPGKWPVSGFFVD